MSASTSARAEQTPLQVQPAQSAARGLAPLDVSMSAALQPNYETPPVGDLILNEQSPATAAPVEPVPAGGMFGGYDEDLAARPQVTPVSWISGPYFRSGVVLPLGGGILHDQHAGYTIVGGYRQPLGPEICGDRVFFDFGGSYQSTFGQNTQFIPEQRVTTQFGIVTNTETIADGRTATLHEVRQGSATASLGWYWGPPLDNRGDDPQLRFATRLGGRVGHARGRFFEEQLPVTLNANQTLAQINYPKTDTFGGLFVGTEAILLNRDFAIGHVQWSVDGQYANDWLTFGGGLFEGSLGTATITTGFMLSW